MDDVVERLRREGANAMRKHYSLGMWQLCAEAATEIERLRGRVAELECDLRSEQISRDMDATKSY